LGFEIKFKGKGLKEIGVVTKINKNSKCKIKVGDVIIKISKKYFRPSEVPFLLGDSNKAKKNLKWTPKHNAKNTCKMMVDNDYKKALEELYLGKM